MLQRVNAAEARAISTAAIGSDIGLCDGRRKPPPSALQPPRRGQTLNEKRRHQPAFLVREIAATGAGGGE